MAGRAATLRIDILADASKANRALDGTSGNLKKWGVAAAAAVAAAGAAVGAFAVQAVQAASRLEQAYGGSEAIFGKYAADVKNNAESAAMALGLAKSEYAELANVIGSQLKNAGTAAKELAPSVDNLIGLGADLAATFGGTTADAVSAVSSLLKGERDPIERYGVSIKQADINARLAAEGLDKLEGNALKQAEAQAALALLTEQTAAAQGMFARESDTLAGQQQRLGALWENLKASLGERLLPVVAQVATFFVERVMPALQRTGDQLSAKLGPAFTAVGNFITTRVVPAARTFITWFQDKIVPGIRSYVTPVLNGLMGAFNSVKAAIDRNRPAINTIGNVLRVLAEFIASRVAPVVGTILGAAFRVLGGIIGGVIDTIAGLINGIRSAVEWIGRLADKIRNSGVGRAISGIAGAVGGLFSSSYGRPAVDGVTAARSLASSRLSAANGGAPLRGAMPRINVAAPTVVVSIGERELVDVAVRVVDARDRATARRLAYGGVR